MRTGSGKSPLCFIFILILFSWAAAFGQVVPRLLDRVDNANRVMVKGDVHRLARAEFDRGAAPADLTMDRMLLMLKRSPEQETELTKLLDDQQDKNSPDYHRWLTPEQFGQQFGIADADLQKITDWLQAQGFHDIQPSKGRTFIEFSGTASQVQKALGTPIRKYVVNGVQHWANAADPTIPAALSPAVRGVFTLHNFFKEPLVHVTPQPLVAHVGPVGTRPQFTASNGLHALVPADYYTIYNFNPLGAFSSSIAIVGRSNINLQDVSYFHYWLDDQAISPNLVLNGPDPGDLGGGEEVEAVLDVTWAGAVAPDASLSLVVSASTATTDGVDLSAQYIIDNNLADVMSESFGSCEANFTSTEAAGVAAMAQQAAAEGITYVVASGDSGSAGCDDPNSTTSASHGLSVSLPASTPYTVAVGGTIFNENGHNSTYWSATNQQPTLKSAISYIPENVWNESCASGQAGCSRPNIWAGGGGKSQFFGKPSWQTAAPGIPADGARDLPDVSLTSAGHDPYLICLRGSCIPDAQGRISFAGVSGTSAATPAFAGIMALVGNKTGARQGQPNYVLYRLAAAENLTQCNASSTTLPASTCVFNDVTSGNNAVPGESGYGSANATYSSGRGFDLATGLGSVNVTNLINQWDTITFNPTSTTFSISPLSGVHGNAFTVSGKVTQGSGSVMPTGYVWLQGGAPHGNLVGDNTTAIFPLDAQGSYSGVTHVLQGGTYQVNAHYAGDGNYGGSDSSSSFQVTIQPEATTTSFSVLTKDTSGNLIPFTTAPYGTPVYYQAHVSGTSGYGVPRAWVNFWDTNGAGAAQVYLDATGNALTPALTQVQAGSHSITAGYYGDNNFNNSVNLTPINFTITRLGTSTSLASQQTSQSFLLNATVSASGIGSPATGLVTLTSGSTTIATVPLNPGSTSGGTTQAIASFDGSQLAAGQYSFVASYPGDTNYGSSTSAPVALTLAADFSIGNRGISLQTVSAGQTASYVNDLGITPFFGYSSTVNVTCSVPAKGTACTVNPSSYSLAAGAGVGTISITTTSRFTALNRPNPAPFGVLLAQYAAAFLLCGFTVCSRGRRLKHPVRWSSISLLLLLAIAMSLLGCGGSGSSGGSGGGGTNPNGTPAGSYTVTVTATDGTVSHTAPFSLNVL